MIPRWLLRTILGTREQAFRKRHGICRSSRDTPLGNARREPEAYHETRTCVQGAMTCPIMGIRQPASLRSTSSPLAIVSSDAAKLIRKLLLRSLKTLPGITSRLFLMASATKASPS